MDTLTQRTAEGHKPPTGYTKTGKPVNQNFLWSNDPRGFGLRCTRAGVKTWIAQGRVGTVDRRVTIGPFNLLKCEAARTRARKVLLDLRDGVDPVVEAQRQAVRVTTLSEVATDYVQHRRTRHGELRAATIADIEKHVATTLAPFANQPVAAITSAMVLARFKELSKTRTAQANQAMQTLQALHGWARKSNPDLPPNPVAVLKGMWNPSVPRTEFVPFNKLRAVWEVLQERRKVVDRMGTALGGDVALFLLSTGARWADATRLTWDCVHLDAEQPWWHVLPERAKNHTERKLPLCRQAAELLRERLAAKHKRAELVFPSHSNLTRTLGQVPAVWELVSETCGVHVTPHSMRRTWTNCALKLGIELWKAELLSCHVPTGVTLRHYFATTDLRDMGAEVQRVADFIEGANYPTTERE